MTGQRQCSVGGHDRPDTSAATAPAINPNPAATTATGGLERNSPARASTRTPGLPDRQRNEAASRAATTNAARALQVRASTAGKPGKLPTGTSAPIAAAGGALPGGLGRRKPGP